MSLSFSVGAVMLRPFLSALSAAARMGEVLTLAARPSCLEVTVVHAASRHHLLLTVAASALDSYRYQPPAAATATTTGDGGGGGGEEEDLHLCVLSKALLATLLKQAPGALEAISFSYTATNSDTSGGNAYSKRSGGGGGADSSLERTDYMEGGSRDAHVSGSGGGGGGGGGGDDVCMRLACECLLRSGVVKRFTLYTVDGPPPSVVRAPRRPPPRQLEAVAAARVWAALLAASHLSERCRLQPLEGRLELSSVAEAEGVAAGVSAGGADGAGSLVADVRRNGMATVTAPADHFDVFQYYVCESPGRAEAEGGGEAEPEPERVAVPLAPLPAKIIESRPIKYVTALAVKLGVRLRLRCSGGASPLVFLSDNGIYLPSPPSNNNNNNNNSGGDANTRFSISDSTQATTPSVQLVQQQQQPPQGNNYHLTYNAAAGQFITPAAAAISFVLHVVAPAIEGTEPRPSGRASDAHNNRQGDNRHSVGSGGGGFETPRGSENNPRDSVEDKDAASNRRSVADLVGGGFGGAPASVARRSISGVPSSAGQQIPPPPPPPPVFYGTPQSSTAAAVAAGPSGGGGGGDRDSQASPSQYEHIGGSGGGGGTQESWVVGTPRPASSSLLPPHLDRRHSIVNGSAYNDHHHNNNNNFADTATPRDSGGTGGTPLVVLPSYHPSMANSPEQVRDATQQQQQQHTPQLSSESGVIAGASDPRRPLQVGPSVTPPPPASSPSLSLGLAGVSASQLQMQQRISALYPLDFEAFAGRQRRHRPTAAEGGAGGEEGVGSDGDDSGGSDAEDEELQRFLESCATSASFVPASGGGGGGVSNSDSNSTWL